MTTAINAVVILVAITLLVAWLRLESTNARRSKRITAGFAVIAILVTYFSVTIIKQEFAFLEMRAVHADNVVLINDLIYDGQSEAILPALEQYSADVKVDPVGAQYRLWDDLDALKSDDSEPK